MHEHSVSAYINLRLRQIVSHITAAALNCVRIVCVCLTTRGRQHNLVEVVVVVVVMMIIIIIFIIVKLCVLRLPEFSIWARPEVTRV